MGLDLVDAGSLAGELHTQRLAGGELLLDVEPVRVQLVDSPGYMINYGLGSVITADIRKHTMQNIGPVDAGNARWYAWLAEKLLSGGQAQETSQLLRDFLGRPVSPQALLEQIERLEVQSN